MLTARKIIPSWVYEICNDKRGIKIFFITGGLGSGKTTNSTIAFIYKILSNPTVEQWWDVAPYYTQADNTLVPTYFFVLREFFGMQEHKDFKLIRSRPNFILLKKTKQKIYFHSGDRPERMVAATIGGYRITEAGIQKPEVFDACTARARDKKTDSIVGLIEGTPEGDNWFREVADFDRINYEKKHRRFILSTQDNAQNLSEDYIDNLLSIYASRPEKIKSYVFGEFASFNRGTAYWDFYESQHVSYNEQPDPNKPIVISWDFNVSPLSWVALQKQNFFATRNLTKLERVVALAESTGESRGLISACAEFVAWLEPDNTPYKHTPILIDGGHDGHNGSIHSTTSAFTTIKETLQKYFSNVKIIAKRSAPRIQARLERVNILFAYKRYLVSSNCPKLINAYNTTSLKPGTWDLAKGTTTDTTHYSDAGDYGVLNLTEDFNLEGGARPKVRGVTRV